MEKSFGKKLARLRHDKGLSQAQLGEVLGYSQRTISDWETDYTRPNYETLRKIVQLFDVRYEDLLDD